MARGEREGVRRRSKAGEHISIIVSLSSPSQFRVHKSFIKEKKKQDLAHKCGSSFVVAFWDVQLEFGSVLRALVQSYSTRGLIFFYSVM